MNDDERRADETEPSPAGHLAEAPSMSSEAPESPPESAESSEFSRSVDAAIAGSPSHRGMTLLWITLLIALVAGGVSVYDLYQGRLTAGKMQITASQLSEVDGRLDEVSPKFEELRRRLNESEHDFDSRLSNGIQDLQAQVDGLRNAVATRQGDDWQPAEVEYLLRIANDSLQLGGRVETAIAALGAADGRLRSHADPAYSETRRLIGEELAALRAVERPDLVGIAAILSGLQDQVENLPANTEVSRGGGEDGTAVDTGTVEERGWRRFFADVWSALKGLVTVRRREVNGAPLLGPDQVEALRLNMILELQTARVAVLRQDTANFHTSVNRTREWLNRFFNPRSVVVTSMDESLAGFDTVELRPSLPDISASLRALRAVLVNRGP
jgi:uroporphyrin-3 C-methyltransferase